MNTYTVDINMLREELGNYSKDVWVPPHGSEAFDCDPKHGVCKHVAMPHGERVVRNIVCTLHVCVPSGRRCRAGVMKEEVRIVRMRILRTSRMMRKKRLILTQLPQAPMKVANISRCTHAGLGSGTRSGAHIAQVVFDCQSFGPEKKKTVK